MRTARTYKVAFPFSNGDYYVEIREGGKFIAWLKNEDVPDDLKSYALPGHKSESVRCGTRQAARQIVWGLAAIETRKELRAP